MSLLIKKIGRKKYAYHAYRVGRKVVHRYIGPVDSPDVYSRVAAISSENSVPSDYHRFFWDTNALKLDTKKDMVYIIERILELGDMCAVKWLEWMYPVKKIMDTLKTTRKISDRSKNFWRIWYER